MSCSALHGDIAQANREIALQGFRDGSIQVPLLAMSGHTVAGPITDWTCAPPRARDRAAHNSLPACPTRLQCLVATNVAARGLDIPEVSLQPASGAPNPFETFDCTALCFFEA